MVAHVPVNREVITDTFQCIVIPWIDVVVVGINDIELCLVHMVPFVSIALMSVQINYQDPFIAKPLPHVVSHYCDVRIDTEATTLVTRGMMVPTSKVDGPTAFCCQTCGVKTAA